MKGRIIYLFGKKRRCANCKCSIENKRKNAKYCSSRCRQLAYLNRIKAKAQFDGIRKVINEVKVDYPKLTFRLSIFGFIASLAFYIGVLRDLAFQPVEKDHQIEQITKENKQLKEHVDLLINKLNEAN